MMVVPNQVFKPVSQISNFLGNYLSDEVHSNVMSAVTASTGASVDLTQYKGVFVRIKEIQILDNHTSGLSLGLWDADADVYPIFMVISDASASPYELKFDQVFNGIRDGNTLSIGNGISLARSYNSVPTFLDIHFLLMKSNQRERDFNKAMNDALSSDQGKSLTKSLTDAVTSVNPIAGVITGLGASLLSLITSILSNEKDEQIYYGVTSLEDYPDVLGIGQKLPDMTDGKNARIAYEIQGIPKA